MHWELARRMKQAPRPAEQHTETFWLFFFCIFFFSCWFLRITFILTTENFSVRRDILTDAFRTILLSKRYESRRKWNFYNVLVDGCICNAYTTYTIMYYSLFDGSVGDQTNSAMCVSENGFGNCELQQMLVRERVGEERRSVRDRIDIFENIIYWFSYNNRVLIKKSAHGKKGWKCDNRADWSRGWIVRMGGANEREREREKER